MPNYNFYSCINLKTNLVFENILLIFILNKIKHKNLLPKKMVFHVMGDLMSK